MESEPLLGKTRITTDHDHEALKGDVEQAKYNSNSPTPRTGEALWRLVQEKLEDGTFSHMASPHHGECVSEIAGHADQELEFSMNTCLIAIAIYLGLGAVAFSCIFDHWSIVDSIYFSVVTFTTVGYGDLVPDTNLGRLFSTIFSLVGISGLGIALGVIGNHLVEAEVGIMEEAKKESNRKNVLSVFGETEKQEEVQVEEEESVKPHHNKVLRYSVGAGVLLFASIFIAWYEGWGWATAVYYCIMTTTTVGYGDFSPSTDTTRLFAVFFIPVAVGVMGEILGSVANYIMERKRQKFMSMLNNRSLQIEDLIAMDSDHDGNVSLLEYVEFMLVSLQKVDKELLQELHDQFEKMDTDHSGSLQKMDLIVEARSKLKRPDKKLSLAMYKHRLMKVSQKSSGF